MEFQKLEARQLLAGVGDWAVIDLRSYLTDTSTAFQDLSGVVFHGNRLAVTANVQPNGAPAEARLLVVDYDLDASTAMDVGEDMKIPSLNGQAGGKTVASAVSSDGSAVYVTGNSLSPQASVHGEAYRAVWDGNQMTNVGLGSIPGVYSQNPVYQSFGYAVNAHGVVAGISDQGRAIFEYDQAMVHVAELTTSAVLLGISDDRVKVGISLDASIWEPGQPPRQVQDPFNSGVLVYGISPDHSRIVGYGVVFGGGGFSTSKLMWWDYSGTAHTVRNAQNAPIDGRLTSATNGNVGYLVGKSGAPGTGDLLHIESSNQTVQIVDWFESISGADIPAETSQDGPEIAFDYDSGQVAIITGGYLLTVKITDNLLPPVARDDAYLSPVNEIDTPVNESLNVAAPGVLGNDTDDGIGPLQAILEEGPKYGTLNLRADGSFVYTPNPGFNREDKFTYKASDGDYESAVATVNITLDTQFPWHNGLSPLNVDDSAPLPDGTVTITPFDALLVINKLNSGDILDLPTTRPRPLAPPFYDTDPNNTVTPLDALLVINELNRPKSPPGGGEGEADTADHFGSSTSVLSVSSISLLSGVDATPAASAEQAEGDSESPVRSPASMVPIGMTDPPIGFELRKSSAADAIWAELDSRWGLTDSEDLLSAILGTSADEA